QVWSAAILSAVLLLDATACSGANKHVNAAARSADTGWQKTAVAIKSRLRGAGYSIYTREVQGRTAAGGARAAGLRSTFVQAPLVPLGAPNPRQAFWIQVDWTSPHTFNLQVLVFRSAADAARAARAIAAESAVTCNGFASAAHRVACTN